MTSFIENRKILFIDDEPELLNAFVSLMRKENVKVKTLHDSKEIEAVLNSDGPFAVVLSDQRMPEYDGVQVLEIVKQKFPETVRVLVTGYADYKDTIRAINVSGITSYISKPWDDNNLKQQINGWISQYNLKSHNEYLLDLLDKENKKLNEVLDGTVAQSVRILGDIANNISPQVAALSQNVKTVGSAFLQAFPNLTIQEKWEIRRAFDLFNVGLALLPAEIQHMIQKHGFSVLDRSTLSRNHHLTAAGLLKDIPRFENVARIIELQARDFNGSGEPLDDKTKGTDIPFGARFLHILINLVKQNSAGTHGSDLLHQMEFSPEKYDIKLIRQILGKYSERNLSPEEKRLYISDLQPGMILVEDVRSKSGQLFLKSGHILTDTFVNILRQWHKRDTVNEPIKIRTIT